MAETTTINLKVTNKNDFTISDRFDGVPYEFEPGKSLTIPPDAALHIFNWQPNIDPAVVFLHVQKRWGWNTPDKAPEAGKFFAKLELRPVTYRMVEVIETSIEDEAPARERAPSGKFVKREERAGATA